MEVSQGCSPQLGKPSTPHVTKLGFPKPTRSTGGSDLEVTQDPKVGGRHPAGISGHLGIWLVLPIQVTVELEQNARMPSDLGPKEIQMGPERGHSLLWGHLMAKLGIEVLIALGNP